MADETPAAAAPSAPPATQAAPPDGSTPPPAAAAPEKVAVTPEAANAQIEASESFDELAAHLDRAEALREEAESQPEAEAAAAAPTPAASAAKPADGASAPSTAAAPAPAEPGSEDETFEDGGDKFTKNFRLHTTDPARSRFLKLLKAEPGANPIELAQRAGYTPPATAAAAPATAAPAAAPVQTIDAVLQPLRDEIAALSAQKRTAREAYEFDKVDEIADQILEKRLALDRKQSELEQEASFQEEYDGGYQGAKAAAIAQYPDTGKRGTPQYEEIMRERAYLEQTEPGFFDDPQYPLELVKRLEVRRPDLFKSGAAPAAAPAAAAPVPAATVTPPSSAAAKQPARPVGAIAAGSETTTTPLTKQTAIAEIDNLSPEELVALADMVGTKGKGTKAHR